MRFDTILGAAALLLLLGAASGSAFAASPVATVSPGAFDRAAPVASPCPAFSWTAVEVVGGYELAVVDESRPSDPQVVLRHRIAGAALSWTPPSDACLPAGSTYAWSVRALDAAGVPLGGEEGWAPLRRFSVPALPSDVEVAAAVEVIRRWQAGQREGERLREAPALASGKATETSGTAAIRGENPGTGTNQHGVWGQSASITGGGLVGVNAAGGPDLVLDGAAQSQADTNFSQSGIDRLSASAQTFDIQNSGAGAMTLQVDGTAVSLAGHLHAGEEIASGTVADVRIASTLTRDSEVMPIVLANDGAGSGLDADLLDGAHAASFQGLVTGTCPLGQAITGINPNGTVVCYEVPVPPRITTVDGALPLQPLGNYTSIAIGTDGFPVISYHDGYAGTLKVTKCNDPACVGGDETMTTVDDPPVNLVGEYTSIAIGGDGFPVISYYDSTAAALKVAKCTDAACALPATITTVDDPPANFVGEGTSIAKGGDGFPVISYYDGTNQSIKVVDCNDYACAGGNETITTVDDPPGAAVGYPAIAIGTGGLPVISYRDSTAQALKVAKCNDVACTQPATITTVDDPPNNLGTSSIAIGADGYPVISYRDSTAQALKVAKCNDPACAGANETITTVDDPANSVGGSSSIAIGSDGFPVISYRDSTALTLKVAKCNDPACAGANETITTVDDPANDVGLYGDIAIGSDGFPVISYTDWTAGALKVAKCKNASCSY